MIIQGRAKGEEGRDLLAYLGTLLPDTRAFDGCESVSVLQDEDDLSAITVWESWQSRRQYLAYLGWRTERGEIDTLNSYFVEMPTLRFLRTTPV